MPSTSSKGRFLLVSTLLVSATSFTVSSNNNLSATYKTTRTRRKTTKHSPPTTGTLLAHSNAGSAGACGGFPFTRRIHATKARLPFQRTTNILSLSTDANVCDSLPEPSSMRIKEIKDELKDKGISFSDCFDKDSLVERLNDARSGKVCKKETPNTAAAAPAAKQNSNSNTSAFDKDAAAAELRTKKVRELRTMCAQNDIRWGGMIEKEEIVQALVAYQEKASNFSPSGKITPGKVAMIDQDILAKEVAPGAATTPLLLDIYATWCGPCKMMGPFLEEAATELKDKVRVAKMDSDQNPEWSGKLKVNGLPTIIVFDGKTGKELERVEGALMKDQLVQLGMKYA